VSRVIKRDIPASVRARLQKMTGPKMTFERLLVRYGVERLLFRLEQSPHADLFMLKGAQLFLLWTGHYFRTTRDMDFLGRGEPDIQRMQHIWKEVCLIPCIEDGLFFDQERVKAEEIREGDGYGGIRVYVQAELSKALINLQIDVGFGDAVTPRPSKTTFPVLLDMSAPTVLTYPRETVVAEKFEAMVKLGLRNTRMKDFYDLWVLAAEFPFDGLTLSKALAATFKRRKTILPEVVPDALTTSFFDDEATISQWRGFLRKGSFTHVEANFTVVCKILRAFVMPPVIAATSDESFEKTWRPGGPWR
jgi:Nucleotidyl transferase AbiEii toxin, Type IV TA system